MERPIETINMITSLEYSLATHVKFSKMADSQLSFATGVE